MGSHQRSHHAHRSVVDSACESARAGLLTPTLRVSDSGNLADLATLIGYDSLKMVCAEHSVGLWRGRARLCGSGDEFIA